MGRLRGDKVELWQVTFCVTENGVGVNSEIEKGVKKRMNNRGFLTPFSVKNKKKLRTFLNAFYRKNRSCLRITRIMICTG